MSVTHEFETKTEHAVMMSGGGMHVRCDDALVEKACPLEDWIDVQFESDRKVYQRTIIVLDDWQEVSPCGDRSLTGRERAEESGS